MDEMMIQMAFAVVLSTVKNPDKKAKLKKAFLKVFKTIKATYADDPDFQ